MFGGKLPDPPPISNVELSRWRKRVESKMKEIVASGEAAPPEIFIEEPDNRKSNLFEAGMLLEAVDKKNPHLLCPARVELVVQDKLFIAFEGYGSAFSYWCDREDRFIFPVNWHKKTNDELQPIGPEADY